jgi:sterol desaturase/sphingolipid hydroxylase (fatty acid hydroxylase superfamily)
MRLSKAAYYSDFVVYALLVAMGCAVDIWRDTASAASIWLLWAFVGVLSWTLVEYPLHRCVLHRIRIFAAMHDAHHQMPLAFIGTPTWLSLGVILGVVFLPVWALGSFRTASGLTVGVMAGFLWYGIVHHAIHYRRPRVIATWLLLASRRHAQHHYACQPGNFGVTTAFWGGVFGTSSQSLNARAAYNPSAEGSARIPSPAMGECRGKTKT